MLNTTAGVASPFYPCPSPSSTSSQALSSAPYGPLREYWPPFAHESQPPGPQNSRQLPCIWSVGLLSLGKPIESFSRMGHPERRDKALKQA